MHVFFLVFFRGPPEVPDPPSTPLLVVVAARNLTVNWSAPASNNAPINQYTVWFQFTYFNGTVFTNTVNITEREGDGSVIREAVLTSLIPVQDYTVRVQAWNAIGVGNFSDSLQVGTLEDGMSLALEPRLVCLNPLMPAFNIGIVL